MKYKAVLELEVCNDLDMQLDIAENLDCYDYDPIILSPEAYAEYVLKEADFDVNDPAFSRFDFKGYGGALPAGQWFCRHTLRLHRPQ